MTSQKLVLMLLLVLMGPPSALAQDSDSNSDEQPMAKEARLLLLEAGAKGPEQVSAIRVEEVKPSKYRRLSQAQAARMRNPASVAYPDGMTGPHSNLFSKVRARYATEKLILPTKKGSPETSH